jgi:hypothetical protein
LELLIQFYYYKCVGVGVGVLLEDIDGVADGVKQNGNTFELILPPPVIIVNDVLMS